MKYWKGMTAMKNSLSSKTILVTLIVKPLFLSQNMNLVGIFIFRPRFLKIYGFVISTGKQPVRSLTERSCIVAKYFQFSIPGTPDDVGSWS